jgi:hypothetical protein
VALLKSNEMMCSLKIGHFNKRRCFLIKEVSEAYRRMEKGGVARLRKCMRHFYKSLNGYGNWIKVGAKI